MDGKHVVDHWGPDFRESQRVVDSAYGPLQGKKKRWVRSRLRLASHMLFFYMCVATNSIYAPMYNYICLFLYLFHYPINSTDTD
jgi:hypothetical protein